MQGGLRSFICTSDIIELNIVGAWKDMDLDGDLRNSVVLIIYDINDGWT